MKKGGYMKKIWTISIIIVSFFTLTHENRVFGGEIRVQERLSENGQVGAAAPDGANGVNRGTSSTKSSVADKSDGSASNSFSVPNSSNNEDKMVRYTKSDNGVGVRK
jgi:hypothetical protein